jgi:hypothetical protein
MMNSTKQTVFIIGADSAEARGRMDELAAFCGLCRTISASSVDRARAAFLKTPPSVVFLDESSAV